MGLAEELEEKLKREQEAKNKTFASAPTENAEIAEEESIKDLGTIIEEEIATAIKEEPIVEEVVNYDLLDEVLKEEVEEVKENVHLVDAVVIELGKHRNNLIDIKDDHSEHNSQMQKKQDKILKHMAGVTKLEKTLYALSGGVVGGILVSNIEIIGRYVEPVGRVIKYLVGD